MKLRTKLVIITLAVFLTLAGANLLASAIVSTGAFASHPSVTVEVTSVRVLI